MITLEQRQELRELDAKRTQGEWLFRNGNGADGSSCDLLMVKIGLAGGDEDEEYAEVLYGQELSDAERGANWDYAAVSANLAPALLDEVERLERHIAVLMGSLPKPDETPAEHLVAIGMGLRDAELGRLVPFDVVKSGAPFEYILKADKERLEADNRTLREALTALRNEVVGLVGIAEEEIRQAVSMTNFRCLKRRIEQADTALAAGKAGE